MQSERRVDDTKRHRPARILGSTLSLASGTSLEVESESKGFDQSTSGEGTLSWAVGSIWHTTEG